MRKKFSPILIFIVLFLLVFLNGLLKQGASPGNLRIPVEDCSMPVQHPMNAMSRIITKPTGEQFRPDYKLGNCHTLEGHHTVVLFFMDDDESSWTADEVRLYTKKYVLPSLDYLSNQAKKWGIDLSFSVKRYSTPLSDGAELTYPGKITFSTWNILEKLSASWGYPAELYLHAGLMDEFGGSPIIPLVITDKSDRSYAYTLQIDHWRYYMEHAVIFANGYAETDGAWQSETRCSKTIAHEILHLFGAEDYYYEQGAGRDQRSILAEQYYRDDIMLGYYDDLHLLRVNDITAYSVGWTDRIPKILYNEDWHR